MKTQLVIFGPVLDVVSCCFQVGKFVGFSKLWSEDDARALAEPEDQDEAGGKRWLDFFL